MTPVTVKAIHTDEIQVGQKGGYIGPFASRVEGRERKALGRAFGLTNYGVNLTRLKPNSESSLLHSHSIQDELVYILEGEPVLVMESEEIQLSPGMCAGFQANGEAHHLVNRTDKDVVFLEIGDRLPGDQVVYPEDDLMLVPGENGRSLYAHKDGTLY